MAEVKQRRNKMQIVYACNEGVVSCANLNVQAKASKSSLAKSNNIYF